MKSVIKSRTLLTISSLIVVCLVSFSAYAKYGSGTGEPNDPYLIYTAEQMNTIGNESNDWDKHFKLMADIDLSIYTGTDFNIIGYTGTDFHLIERNNAFTGVFDGNGHIISNFSYTSTDKRYIGLFGCIGATGIDAATAIGTGKDAMIKDLELIEPNIDAGTGDDVGALVGGLGLGTITNCSVKGGTVSGNRGVGGLVGYNFGGEITNCYVTGNVEGVNNVGGLVGTNSSSFGKRAEITNCYSVGSVTGNKRVGGLVGNNASVWAAIMWSATISNCYSIGNVFGIEYVGGLVGDNFDGSSIIKCYAAGRVTGTTVIGGLVGDNSYYPSTITVSFWDIETSGRSNMCGIEIPGGSGCDDANGKTTTEMQTASTFLDAGWDFVDETANGTEDIWWIDEGQDYPRLWWEQFTDDMLFLVVDDFESYNDLDPDHPESNRIWNTWLDGYDNPNNGSIVGYLVWSWFYWFVHSGEQSMPFSYDNSGPANYSEATANIDNLVIDQDWTLEGARVLALWFYGDPANAPETMYVALANVNGPPAIVYHDNPDAALIEAWMEWRIDLHAFADQGVDLANINTISIGFGDKDNPQAGGSGQMHFDDIRLYRSAPYAMMREK
jgi:hypothetical protein